MFLLPLTKGRVARIDDADAPLVAQFRWHCVVTPQGKVYAGTWVRRRDGSKARVYLHRLLLNAPAGLEVDHIDGDTLNNQRNNLRLATRAQNQQNAKKHEGSTSRYKGVFWDSTKGRWGARIGVAPRKQKFLGNFDDEAEAALAYDEAAVALFGERARVNFPERRAA